MRCGLYFVDLYADDLEAAPNARVLGQCPYGFGGY